MKKLKVFLCVALFGAMSFGAFSAYEHYTMSDAERALLENVEALTSGEFPDGGKPAYSCQVGKLKLKQSDTDSPVTWCGDCTTRYVEQTGDGTCYKR